MFGVRTVLETPRAPPGAWTSLVVNGLALISLQGLQRWKNLPPIAPIRVNVQRTNPWRRRRVEQASPNTPERQLNAESRLETIPFHQLGQQQLESRLTLSGGNPEAQSDQRPETKPPRGLPPQVAGWGTKSGAATRRYCLWC